MAEQTQKPLYATNAYNNLGLISGSRVGMNNRHCTTTNRLLTYRKQTGDEMGLAASHNNIGIIYENSGDYRSAENHYLNALKLAEKTRFQEVETAVLANLGQLAELRERYSEAVC